MIQLPANANIVVMHEPVSFRNGIEGTAGIARLSDCKWFGRR